jgi:hypothetical protein
MIIKTGVFMKKTIIALASLISFSAFSECRDIYQYRIDNVKNFSALKVTSGALTLTSAAAISGAMIPYGISASIFAGGILSGPTAAIGFFSISDQWLNKLSFEDVLKIINEAELGDGKMINEFVTSVQNISRQYTNYKFTPTKNKVIETLLISNDSKQICPAFELKNGDAVGAPRDARLDVTIDNKIYDLFSGPEIAAIVSDQIFKEMK